MRRSIMFAAAALLSSTALPALAAADTARVTTDLNMRAGPSTEFPVVVSLAEGAVVDIYGCLSGYSWCDVSWDGNRGWVAAGYLTHAYEGAYVPIIEYGDEIDLPVIAFSVGTYWDDYYRNRPWYGRRNHWRTVWRGEDHDRGGPGRRERRENRADRSDQDRNDNRQVERRDRNRRTEQVERRERSSRSTERRAEERGNRRSERRAEERGNRRSERRAEERGDRRMEQRGERSRNAERPPQGRTERRAVGERSPGRGGREPQRLERGANGGGLSRGQGSTGSIRSGGSEREAGGGFNRPRGG